MNLDFATQSRAMRVGNLSGWALGFLSAPAPNAEATLTLTHQDYYAKIEATLPGDLSGGRFQVTIDALTDAHYRSIKSMPAADLFLFWQDVNANLLGYLGNLAGIARGPSAADLAPALVARIAITKVRRRPGKRSYETVIEGRDWAFHQLAKRPAPRVCYVDIAAALRGIGEACNLTVTPEPGESNLLGAAVPPEAEQADPAGPGTTCLDMVRVIGRRIAEGLRNDAPSVVLLGDGAVRVGRRAIPFPAGTEALVLGADNGLVQATPSGGAEDGGRAHWILLCRGRPDIKPGAVLRFKRPPEDVDKTVPDVATALLGSLAGLAGIGSDTPDTAVYVDNVVHKQSRTEGFQTEINGIELPDPVPLEPWTAFLAATDGPRGRPVPSADASTAVVRQVRDLARAAIGRLRLPEVGEVRSAVASTGTPPEPPAQTVTVWEGTQGDSGQANAARRQPIMHATPVERRGVATLTPFAWGQCGLVVPRYPGMRVALAFRNGKPEDPLDIGALWGDASRMQAQPGDWWLCLPVDAPTTALEPSNTSGREPTGKGVHDLTDAAGTRVIQVGRLTVRVGKDQLPELGTRPEAAPEAAVTIEHADGNAAITIDADGRIILRGTDITIDAGTTGTVSISAREVNVAVQQRMTVS